MNLEDDNMKTWYHFTLKCDCGTSVNCQWAVCPVCTKPITKPNFGKPNGVRISLRPSEIIKLIEKEIFNRESEVNDEQ